MYVLCVVGYVLLAMCCYSLRVHCCMKIAASKHHIKLLFALRGLSKPELLFILVVVLLLLCSIQSGTIFEMEQREEKSPRRAYARHVARSMSKI